MSLQVDARTIPERGMFRDSGYRDCAWLNQAKTTIGPADAGHYDWSD
jgi:hypothetical protein